MSAAQSTAQGAANFAGIALALPLLAGVLLLGVWLSRRAPRKRGVQPLWYVAEGKTAAACRGLHWKPNADDIFLYEWTSTTNGALNLHLKEHRPTGQLLDTVFLVQFEDDDPAVFSVRFVREAFGMREPVVGGEVMDAFFAQKLDARPCAAPGAPP